MFPANYKKDILTQLQTQLDDPTGVREAFIAEPVLKTSHGTTRYIACVRFNARNADGQYSGSKDMAGYFFNSQLTQIVNADRELCGTAAYQPFPELQRLCRTGTCS